MSLSWTESLRVSLCPDRVGLVRMSRGRLRMLDANVAVCSAPEPGNPSWSASLAALGQELAIAEARNGEVTVVLSNHFVRYLLVPRNDALSGEAESLAHARHAFSRVYGAVAESWDIRLSDAYDGARVASAVDSELLAGLDRAVASSGRRLASVQPYLMAAFNRWRRELVEPLVWFILAEPGRLCLAALQNGRWSQLINLQADADWARQLPGLLTRQRVLSELDGIPGKVYLADLDEEAELILKQSGEQVRRLPPASQPATPPEVAAFFEMALNG